MNNIVQTHLMFVLRLLSITDKGPVVSYQGGVAGQIALGGGGFSNFYTNLGRSF